MFTCVWQGRFACFIFGIVCVVIFLLLTGAAGSNQSVGKYQMEAFARDNITNIYIMDTTTGRVKWLDELNTPFEKMKAD